MIVNICASIFGEVLNVPSKNHVELSRKISIFLRVANTMILSGAASSSSEESDSPDWGGDPES